MGAGLSLQHRLGSEVSLSSVIHCNSFSPIASGHLPESFNYIFPLPEWNLLEIKDSLTHVYIHDNLVLVSDVYIVLSSNCMT